MPEVYRVGNPAGGDTPFQVFAGDGLLFGGPKPVRFRDVRDGMAHTLLIAVTGPDRAVPWTKPDDLALNPVQPLAALGTLPDDVLHCALADGSLLSVAARFEPSVMTALATPAGGEVIDVDALRRNDLAAAGESPRNVGSEMSAQQQLRDLQQKLRQLALAMQNYHDVHRSFPVAGPKDHFDETGRPRLSWRVHLLPFLEQQPLYDQFHLDEAWDSPHNRALADHMPEVFRAPDDDARTDETRFVTLMGPTTLFGPKTGPRMRDVVDGPSNTILVVEVAAARSVPWTKPDDIAFDPVKPLDCLGDLQGAPIVFCLVDGSVWAIKPELSPTIFGALVTPRGKEVYDRKELEFLRVR
jgi:hypothetical protein